MAYTVYITPSAISDIEEALKYYNSKVSDLGFRFADDVDDNLQSIAKNLNSPLPPSAIARGTRHSATRSIFNLGKLQKLILPYVITLHSFN